VSEVEDAKSILRMLLEYPSRLGKKELGRLRISAWQLLAAESADLEQIAQIITRLREGRQRGRGRKVGSIARDTIPPDQLVFQEIKNGATVEKAIIKIYGDEGFEAHERRIKRRKQELKFLGSRRGDIK
jgi:hypothetical protein